MKISTPPARFAVFLIIAATLACLLPAAWPRPCNALAISKGLSFYANDLEYYYQHRRTETLPGILRTFDGQGVLKDSLKQIMLATFLAQVLRDDPSARQRLLPPQPGLSRDGRRTLAWMARLAQLPDEEELLATLLQPEEKLLLQQIRHSPAPLVNWDIYSEKSVLQMYWAAFMASGSNEFLDVIIRAALHYAKLNSEGLRNNDSFSGSAAAAASLYDLAPRHPAVQTRLEQFLKNCSGPEAETLKTILRK